MLGQVRALFRAKSNAKVMLLANGRAIFRREAAKCGPEVPVIAGLEARTHKAKARTHRVGAKRAKVAAQRLPIGARHAQLQARCVFSGSIFCIRFLIEDARKFVKNAKIVKIHYSGPQREKGNMPDYIPKSDVEASAFLGNMLTVVDATEADYGLVAGDVADHVAALAAFNAAVADVAAAKAALATAVATKDAARVALESLVRPTVAQIQVNPAVSDAARTAAQIPIRDTVRTVHSPIAVLALVAVLASPTTAGLTWNSNGNASGIKYRIEKRVNNAGDWILVDVTSATRANVPGLAAGVRVDFRVIAQRGTAQADASNIASVYAG